MPLLFVGELAAACFVKRTLAYCCFGEIHNEKLRIVTASCPSKYTERDMWRGGGREIFWFLTCPVCALRVSPEKNGLPKVLCFCTWSIPVLERSVFSVWFIALTAVLCKICSL